MSDFLAKAKANRPRAASKELVELLFYRPYCKIQFLADSGIAKRQTASNDLKQLADADLLKPVIVGREMLCVNHGILNLLSRPNID